MVGRRRLVVSHGRLATLNSTNCRVKVIVFKNNSLAFVRREA